MADPHGETRIYRYEVPVDDQTHTIRIPGNPIHVACRDPRIVEFWAVAVDGYGPGIPRNFRVVGTGHPIPTREPLHDGWRYIGTAIAPGGALVWHLIEVADHG